MDNFSQFHYLLINAPYLVNVHPAFIYFIVFGTTLLESIPVIGTFAPGTLLLLLFGFMSTHHSLSLIVVIISAAIGGVVGDLIGYYMGRHGFKYLNRFPRIVKYSKIESGNAFFLRHGGKSVLFARFIGPIRPIVPMFAGAAQMPMRKFLFWNITGSILWATIYISLGYVFGANFKFLAVWASRAGIFGFFVIIVLITLYGWKEKKTQQVLDELKEAAQPDTIVIIKEEISENL